MKKFSFLLFLAASLLVVPACETLQGIADKVLSDPSLDEIVRGLKEALTKGANKGAGELSQRDGYFKSAYKILLPADIRKVTDRLKNVPGFGNLENELVEKMNRGAEDAAREAAPIFGSAIRNMTF